MQSIQFMPKLSEPKKMPCHTFSTPATACHTGGKLAKIKGSVCHNCYAMKGNYVYPNVKAHREHNLKSLSDLPSWKAGMIAAIKSNDTTGYFRWHDSGDIQSEAHLMAIMDIAEAMPEVIFWLPTKEKGMLAKVNRRRAMPDNFTVRLSMPMLDMAPAGTWPTTSTVITKAGTIDGVECKAPANNGKCGTCRACWDKTVSNVTYLKH
jgi:hypothetical protein